MEFGKKRNENARQQWLSKNTIELIKEITGNDYLYEYRKLLQEIRKRCRQGKNENYNNIRRDIEKVVEKNDSRDTY